MNVLAIGAHPDDIELGCGGAISKHLELGDEVHILILTNGEKGKHATNMEECFNSLQNIGIKRTDIILGGFSDGFVKDNQELVNFIEEQINKFSISRIYTHTLNDRHQDHRNCSLAVSSAARKTAEILQFQGPSTNTSFAPHYYISLSENQINKKLNSLNSYQTQIQKGIIKLEWVKSLAIVHGMTQDAHYAEAFEINHLLKRENEI